MSKQVEQKSKRRGLPRSMDRQTTFRLMAITFVYYLSMQGVSGIIRGDVPDQQRPYLILATVVLLVANTALLVYSVREWFRIERKREQEAAEAEQEADQIEQQSDDATHDDSDNIEPPVSGNGSDE